jgi:3',5'-cyclic AMP phosphodiesterase CpdA
VPIRLVHVSDLHIGAGDDRSLGPALGEVVAERRPAAVVVTGDLTHRGRADQHDRAATLLQGLGVPVLSVPGNHDIPYTVPARFTRPWAEFERRWETTEPVFAADGLHVVGLNSARPWRHQSGGVGADALERAAARLRGAAPGALRVVCLHHHLTGAPWRSRKRPLARRGQALGALVGAGAELILSGHIHQSAASERREFEIGLGPDESVVAAIAPGFGQPRPHRRGEARGLHVVEADEHEIAIETLAFDGEAFNRIAERRFPRRQPRPEPPA